LQSIANRKKIGKSGNTTDEAHLDLAEHFREYHPRIYNYLRYRVSTPEDAEDLIGTIFEQAYTHRQQFDPTKGAFSAWLFRIAHNALVDHYRTHERRSTWETEADFPPDLVTPEPSLEAQMVHQETIAQLLQSLKGLSERDQEVLSLKFAGKLRNKEIGEILNMKEKTVSVALLRAMRRLRQQMEKEAAHE
jgi:RNA polymerase sigma factor (sigma-70 family)